MYSPLFERSTTEEPSTAASAIDAFLDDRHPMIENASTWAVEHRADFARGIDRDNWRLFASAGFQAITTPTKLGGLGRSTVDAMLAFEGLGHGCEDNGLVFALSSQVFATQNALRSAASPEQLAAHLPGLLSGDTFGAFAITEPDAGSDSSAIRTVARRVDAHPEDPAHDDATYEVSGEKCWITLGPNADLIILFATTNPSLGKWGITAFVVDAKHPGVECGPAVQKLGLDQSPFGTISFDRCRLTAADRLGPEGAGGSIFTKAVEGERAFLFAGQLGSARRVVERAVHHARSTVTRGDDAAATQTIGHRIADMQLNLEMARLLVYKAAILNDRGKSVGMAAALAKLQTSEMAVNNALEAVSLRGPAGYLQESMGSEVHDALGGLAYSGTSDIQRMIIAGLLRVDAPLRTKPTARSEPTAQSEPTARPDHPVEQDPFNEEDPVSKTAQAEVRPLTPLAAKAPQPPRSYVGDVS